MRAVAHCTASVTRRVALGFPLSLFFSRYYMMYLYTERRMYMHSRARVRMYVNMCILHVPVSLSRVEKGSSLSGFSRVCISLHHTLRYTVLFFPTLYRTEEVANIADCSGGPHASRFFRTLFYLSFCCCCLRLLPDAYARDCWRSMCIIYIKVLCSSAQIRVGSRKKKIIRLFV